MPARRSRSASTASSCWRRERLLPSPRCTGRRTNCLTACPTSSCGRATSSRRSGSRSPASAATLTTGSGLRSALGGVAGELQHQLAPDRFGKLRPVVDRDHEGARPADHAVGVVDVEIVDVEDARHAALGHQRQAVDGDALRDDLVADLDRPAAPGCWRRRRKRRPPASGRESCSRRTGRRRIAARWRSRCGARCSAGWRRACSTNASRVRGRGDHRPRHDDVLRGLSRPIRNR